MAKIKEATDRVGEEIDGKKIKREIRVIEKLDTDTPGESHCSPVIVLEFEDGSVRLIHDRGTYDEDFDGGFEAIEYGTEHRKTAPGSGDNG